MTVALTRQIPFHGKLVEFTQRLVVDTETDTASEIELTAEPAANEFDDLVVPTDPAGKSSPSTAELARLQPGGDYRLEGFIKRLSGLGPRPRQGMSPWLSSTLQESSTDLSPSHACPRHDDARSHDALVREGERLLDSIRPEGRRHAVGEREGPRIPRAVCRPADCHVLAPQDQRREDPVV